MTIIFNGTEMPEIGTMMPDGTIYCGISTHQKPLYAMPVDAPGERTWHHALEYVKELNAHGHNDWRLPDKYELDLLYVHKDKIGGFSPRWYWSSSEYHLYYAYLQHFEDGIRHSVYKDWASGLVRSARS